MSKKQKKNLERKKINKRVFFVNSLMVVSVVALVAALTLVAMGYRLSDGELTQYGLLQVMSIPSGASVDVDGVKVDTTGMNRMVSSGSHNLLVTKSGYDVWRADVAVKPGLLARIDYVRLFPVQRVTETVKEYEDMVRVVAAPTRDSLVVVRSGAVWTVIEGVDGREVRTRDVEVPAWLAGQEMDVRKWNKTGDRMFVRMAESGDWGVVDLRAVDRSVNISTEFFLRLDDVAIADDSGEKIYGLVEGGLRVVDLKTRHVSDVKMTGVESIGGVGEGVGYVRKVEETWEVGVYKDGNSKGSVLQTSKIEGAKVMAWKYWGEDVAAVVVDGEMTVTRGRTYSSDGMEEVMSAEISDETEAGGLSISPSGRFAVLWGAMVVDVNSGVNYEYDVAYDGWLDDFMMYAVRDGVLSVWDFDGGNERELNEAANSGVMIAKGNGWLYHAGGGDEGMSKILREKL